MRDWACKCRPTVSPDSVARQCRCKVWYIREWCNSASLASFGLILSLSSTEGYRDEDGRNIVALYGLDRPQFKVEVANLDKQYLYEEKPSGQDLGAMKNFGAARFGSSNYQPRTISRS